MTDQSAQHDAAEDLPEWERELYLEQARLERYAEVIDPGAMDLNRKRSSHAVARRRRALEAARAVIALVDEEHDRLSAESQMAIATAVEAIRRQRGRAEAAEARVAELERS